MLLALRSRYERLASVSANIVSSFTLADTETVAASVSADSTSRFWLADVEIVADAVAASIISVSTVGATGFGHADIISNSSLTANAQGAIVTLGGSSGGGGRVPFGRIRIHPRRPGRPVRSRKASVLERLAPVVLEAVRDDSNALVALYAAGVIDVEEFAALIAA